MNLVKNIKLKISADDDYEWLINEDTGEIIAEAPRLRVEDVLYGLGYRFAIEIDPNQKKE